MLGSIRSTRMQTSGASLKKGKEEHMKRITKITLFTLGLTALAAGVGVAWADSGAASFVFLAASGPTCGIVFPPPTVACPDVSRAANGDTVEVTGAGTLSVMPTSVAGGGTFTHKNPAGGIIAFGVWTATELLS